MEENNKTSENISAVKQLTVMIILFLLALIIFVCLYTTQNKEIKETLESTLNKTHTNFMQIVIENDNTQVSTNKKIVPIEREEFYSSINRAFESHYTIVRESVDSIVKNQTNMLSFWFSFLSIVMVVFTVLGIFINNRILENAKSEARNTIRDIQKEAKEILSKLENDAVEAKESANRAEAGRYFSMGIHIYDSGNIDKCIRFFSKAIKLDNEFAEAYNMRGFMYYERSISYSEKHEKSNDKKYYEEALKDYDKAIELSENQNEKDKDFYYNRGLLYSRKYENSSDNEDYKKALDDCNEAVKLNEEDSSSYNNRGYLYIKKYKKFNCECEDDFDNALENFNKAIELNKEIPTYYDSIGYAYLVRFEKRKSDDDYKIASEKFQKALELENSFGVIEKNFNELKELKKKFDKENAINAQIYDH